MLIRTSVPAGLAVPLEEVKSALRVDFTDDDDRIEQLIRQETRRYEDYTNRIMLPTEFELQTDTWAYPLQLPVAPIREVTEIAYNDDLEAEQTIDPTHYYTLDFLFGTQLWYTDAFTSPSTSERYRSIKIRFSAGYDDPASPESGSPSELFPVQQDAGVITAMVGWLYDKGEAMPVELLNRMASTRRMFF